MGILRNNRAIFANKRTRPSQSHHFADSKRNLIPSPVSSIWHRKKHFLKKRGKAFGHHVLAKFTLNEPNDKAGKDYLERSATSSVNEDIRGSVFRERYVSIRLLGEGGNGTVHLCRDTKVGTLVAVKTIHHDESLSPPNEAHILNLLSYHRNIVQYHTMLNHPTLEFHMQLIFEYCPIGDLVDYVNAAEDDITELFLWHVFKHVAAGIHYIHQNGIVHGDIKPCNILLTAPSEGEIYPLPRIADFGSAQVNPPYNIPYGHLCTQGWQPPEAEHCHSPAADMWALGCIIHELALGHLPQHEIEPPAMDPMTWFDLSGKQIPTGTEYRVFYKQFCFYMAFHPRAPARIDLPPSSTSTVYSKLLNYLMMRTLDINPRSRISSHEFHHILRVLEPLVHNLLVVGQESILDRFDEGRDSEWKQVAFITDSQVFRQIFCAAALEASRECNMEMLSWSAHLLEFMDPEDQVAACQCVADLGICATS